MIIAIKDLTNEMKAIKTELKLLKEDKSKASDKNNGGGGGFWYHTCIFARLTNPLLKKGETTAESDRGIQWHQWIANVNLKKAILKISPHRP